MASSQMGWLSILLAVPRYLLQTQPIVDIITYLINCRHRSLQNGRRHDGVHSGNPQKDSGPQGAYLNRPCHLGLIAQLYDDTL